MQGGGDGAGELPNPAGRGRHRQDQLDPQAPSLDALVRIAQTFNVSVDYLVVPDATRRPLHAPANALSEHLADFDTLQPNDQAALLNVLDALITKNKLRALTAGAS